MSPELLAYIEEARKTGASDSDIRSNLLSAGWDANLVGEAFLPAQNPPAAPPAEPPVLKTDAPTAVGVGKPISGRPAGWLIGVLAVGVGTVMVIGGIIWAFFALKSQLSPAENISANVPAAPSSTVAMPTAPERQNCGSIRSEIVTGLVFGTPPSSPQTPEEAAAIACADAAMKNCGQAQLSFIGDAPGAFTVLGREQGTCALSQTVTKQAVTFTCKVPNDLMGQLIAEAEDKSASVSLGASFMLSLGTTGGTMSIKNASGTKVNLDCTSTKTGG